MPNFHFSKIDHYRQSNSKKNDDVIDIQFPSELNKDKKNKETKKDELLFFVVDDDPVFMQLLNTHLSKCTLSTKLDNRPLRIQNYATGRSCIKNLNLKPDIIFLNYDINNGMPNAMKGKEILDTIIETNPNQKVLILNELETSLRNTFVENGLRDYIISDPSAVAEVDAIILNILKS